MKERCQPLLSVLADSQTMAGLDPSGWDLLIRQASGAGLLSRLALEAGDALGLTESLGKPIQRHLIAAGTLAERQRRAVAWEARKLDQALASLRIPVVLLKGAAYALAALPPARGRLLVRPTKGGSVRTGSKYGLNWASVGTIAKVDLAYTLDGTKWTTIANSVSNPGPFAWTVPNTKANNVRIRVSEANGSVKSISDPFNIVE